MADESTPTDADEPNSTYHDDDGHLYDDYHQRDYTPLASHPTISQPRWQTVALVFGVVMCLIAVGMAAVSLVWLTQVQEDRAVKARERDHERIRTELAMCERVNDLRVQTVVLGQGAVDMGLANVELFHGLAEVLSRNPEAFVELITPPLNVYEERIADHQALVDDFEFTVCSDVVLGAERLPEAGFESDVERNGTIIPTTTTTPTTAP